MQKTVEGVYSAAEKIEDRSRIGGKHNQNHAEKRRRIYLEPIRNRMHVPIEGLSRTRASLLFKEGGVLDHEQGKPTFPATTGIKKAHKSPETHTHGTLQQRVAPVKIQFMTQKNLPNMERNVYIASSRF